MTQLASEETVPYATRVRKSTELGPGEGWSRDRSQPSYHFPMMNRQVHAQDRLSAPGRPGHGSDDSGCPLSRSVDGRLSCGPLESKLCEGSLRVCFARMCPGTGHGSGIQRCSTSFVEGKEEGRCSPFPSQPLTPAPPCSVVGAPAPFCTRPGDDPRLPETPEVLCPRQPGSRSHPPHSRAQLLDSCEVSAGP